MPEVISRKDALARGLTRYFTGEPCKHGHVTYGWVSTRGCVECQRLRAQTPVGKEYGDNMIGSESDDRPA